MLAIYTATLSENKIKIALETRIALEEWNNILMDFFQVKPI